MINIRWTGQLTAITSPLISVSDGTLTSLSGNLQGPAGGESCTSHVRTVSVMSNPNKLCVVTVSAVGVLPAVGNSVYVVVTEINPWNY